MLFAWLCFGKCKRVCTKAKRECVQNPSALANECVAKQFLSDCKNQRGNGYNWRKSIFVEADCVPNCCSMSLVAKWGFIMSLLTIEGREPYDFLSQNFSYHRPCMITSIVCKTKRIKSTDIGMNDTSKYYCSHAFSPTNAFEVQQQKRHIFVQRFEDSRGTKRVCCWRQRVIQTVWHRVNEFTSCKTFCKSIS